MAEMIGPGPACWACGEEYGQHTSCCPTMNAPPMIRRMEEALERIEIGENHLERQAEEGSHSSCR